MPPPLDQSPARKTFTAYKNALFKVLGRKETDSGQLNAIGKHEFGSAWGGVHSQDRVRLLPNKYYVVNTDTHDKPGEHWVGLYTTKTKAYIYDSYGRPVKPLVSHLITNIQHHGFKIGGTNREPHGEQIGYTSSVCGQNSLAFLLVVRDLGIRAASEI